MQNLKMGVHSLRDVIQYEIPAIFRRQHLNRDVIIGLIGDRGDGKTLGGGIIAGCDYLLQNEPCFSNLEINMSFNMDDQTAAKYGLAGGIVEYQSQKLDMVKFLRFAPEYQGGVFFIDEINIALADARRSMSNQNLWATDVGQQLRKLQSALVYTSIHEMFVESRIRDMTDIFINTKDVALSPEGLAAKKKPGLEFIWTIYPMSRKLTGVSYQESKQTIKATLHGHRWWGAVNTLQRQDRQKYKVPLGSSGVNMDIIENPAITMARSKWGWLYKAIKQLHDDGYTEIHSEELWEYLQVRERKLSRIEVGRQLSDMNVKTWRHTTEGYYYAIDKFDLSRGYPDEEDNKEAIIVR